METGNFEICSCKDTRRDGYMTCIMACRNGKGLGRGKLVILMRVQLLCIESDPVGTNR